MHSNKTINASVVILTKNPGAVFREVLNSVINQETDLPFETIVVDSGSNDGTIEFIKSFPQVRLIEIPASEFGHGKTRNYGVELASGKYVAMLTHDAQPCNSRWLNDLLKPFAADDQVAGVFGRHHAYPEARHCTKRDLQLHFDHFLQWPQIIALDDKERYSREQGYRQVLHYFSDNNACLRKEVWRRIPYANVNFAEDQMWAQQIIEAGYKKAYASDAAVFHSHDYTIKDTFRRSYDESVALRKLFGYNLCPSLAHCFYQIYACNLRDAKYLWQLPNVPARIPEIIKQSVLNFAKQMGFWVGAKQSLGTSRLYGLLSLDDAKKRE